jgi:hypothetical protein
MHPFPPITVLPTFEGDAIAQIWLDPYAVRFLFESKANLYAQHRIVHLEPNGTLWSYECEAANGLPLVLHRLLYRRIIAVEREDLRLTFNMEDGASLAIISELGPYESGHIGIGGNFTVF